jgi:hypothetical protein
MAVCAVVGSTNKQSAKLLDVVSQVNFFLYLYGQCGRLMRFHRLYCPQTNGFSDNFSMAKLISLMNSLYTRNKFHSYAVGKAYIALPV